MNGNNMDHSVIPTMTSIICNLKMCHSQDSSRETCNEPISQEENWNGNWNGIPPSDHFLELDMGVLKTPHPIFAKIDAEVKNKTISKNNCTTTILNHKIRNTRRTDLEQQMWCFKNVIMWFAVVKCGVRSFYVVSCGVVYICLVWCEMVACCRVVALRRFFCGVVWCGEVWCVVHVVLCGVQCTRVGSCGVLQCAPQCVMIR